MKLNNLKYKLELCFGCTAKTIKDTLPHPCQLLKIPDNLTVTHCRWTKGKIIFPCMYTLKSFLSVFPHTVITSWRYQRISYLDFPWNGMFFCSHALDKIKRMYCNLYIRICLAVQYVYFYNISNKKLCSVSCAL